MLQTVEMRWFFAHCPLAIESHFAETLADATELQRRTDWYSMPCNPACGIKVREGKLETKALKESFGLKSLSPFEGYLEAWQKWSLEFPADEHPDPRDLERIGWFAVHKQRRLQRFQVSGNDVTSVAIRPTNGCEFELTELTVKGQTSWTVGFEAVGDASQLESNLRAVAAHVASRDGRKSEFVSDKSFGYAEWLSRFSATSGP